MSKKPKVDETSSNTESAGTPAEGEPTPMPPKSALVAELVAANLGLEERSAAILVGYLGARRGVDGDPIGMPEDPIAYARGLRAQPVVWSALLATDYVRLARALEVCGLPVVSSTALQHAASELAG